MSKEKSSSKSKSKSDSKSKTKEKKVKKIRYAAFSEEYKGSPIIAIREVDKEGNYDEEKFPVVSFGKTKAKAIVACMDEIKEIFESDFEDN